MTAEETSNRTDLSDLVRARMKEKGQGVRTLADACIDPKNPDAGPLWKRGTIGNLINGRRIKAPNREQLRALAAGLDFPEGIVRRAARAQFIGDVAEHWNDDHDIRVLISHVEELDAEGRKEVIDQAEAALRRQAQRSSGQG